MDITLVPLALSVGTPSDFELFGQAALQIALGMQFEPTGGTRDGGQDGFLRSISGKPQAYIQISGQKDFRSKINSTLTRLSKSGRAVSSLTYVTPLHVPDKDVVEAEIEKNTGVAIRIRDQRWLMTVLSTNAELQGAFKDRYAAALHALKDTTEHSQQRYATAERLSVLVYLENHEKSEPQRSELLPLAIDAAIFMALKDTDPELDEFLSEENVIKFVETFFYQIKTKAATLVPVRLAHLRTKQGNPRIRFHQGARYALPYEVRSEFSAQNVLLQQIDFDFWQSVRERILAIDASLSAPQQAMVQDAVSFALYKTFEHQGLNLMASTQGADSYEEIRTYEFVHESISAATADGALRTKLLDVALGVLRKVYYAGNESENLYLYRLFKLYSIDFIIKGDEKVWRYFRNVIRRLKLVVGTDIIVRALSEMCVLPNSRATQNALNILRKLDAKLLLSEHVLHEVYTHIRSTDREFETYYKPWAQHVTIDDAKQCSKILIRAYFYSRLEPQGHSRSPANWDEFLGQFGMASWFREEGNEQAFAAYLQNKFGFIFMPRHEVSKLVTEGEARPLADKFKQKKHDNYELALNDAYMMLYVQAARTQDGETFSADVHGFATWWLTEEHHAVEIAKSHGLKDRIKMHPQFLMNYIAAVPEMREVADRNANSFPTIFGLRITHRIGDEALHEFLRGVVEIVKADEAVVRAKIRDLSNRLMAKRSH